MQPTYRPVPERVAPHPAAPNTTIAWTCLALIAALVVSLGSVALSLPDDLKGKVPTVNIQGHDVTLGKHLKACPLCFYQRTFAFATFGVLLIGLLTGARRTGAIGVIALPLALAGLGIAGFHEWLEYNQTLECPKGLADIGTGPQQSLAGFGVLTLLLLIDAIRNSAGGAFGFGSILMALILAGAFAYGCIVTAPKMADPPTSAYDPEKQPLEMCRPPYKETAS
jgi:disulfide bond formation protein DsbB